jgi:hypothetical protein
MSDDIDAAQLEALGQVSASVWAAMGELGRLRDQPPPKTGTGDVWAEILASGLLSPELAALAEERRRVGIERYGVPLQRDNGRDHLADALAEALDLIVYLRADGWSFERIDYFVKGAEQIVAEMRPRGAGR